MHFASDSSPWKYHLKGKNQKIIWTSVIYENPLSKPYLLCFGHKTKAVTSVD